MVRGALAARRTGETACVTTQQVSEGKQVGDGWRIREKCTDSKLIHDLGLEFFPTVAVAENQDAHSGLCSGVRLPDLAISVFVAHTEYLFDLCHERMTSATKVLKGASRSTCQYEFREINVEGKRVDGQLVSVGCILQ